MFRKSRMPLFLLSPLLLAGCATGYLADRFQDRAQIVETQLIRFGLSTDDGHCVAGRLGARLSIVQLRQLEMRARVVRTGLSDPNRLTLNDLIIVTNGLGDPEVRGELDQAVAQCNIRAASLSVGTAIATAAPAPGPAGQPGAGTIVRGADGQPLTALPAPDGSGGPVIARGADGRPLAELPRPDGSGPVRATEGLSSREALPSTMPDSGPAWLNLGAAGSGQAIAIDGSSVEREGEGRTAWFRMVDPGQPASRTWFRLRIDCRARTIEPKAMRRVDENGAVLQEQVYPPGYERPGPVENGTVMEIAFLSLCT